MAKRFVGAKGAKVVCKAFCFITEGYTDSYGRYSTNSKRGRDWNVEYEIQWRSPEWKVQDNNSKKEAVYVGPKRNTSWNLDIKGGKQESFATITRALERMYNQYNENVMRPTGTIRVKVVCFDSSPTGFGAAYFSGNSFLGLDTKAEITIWNRTKGSASLVAPSLLFSYMIHELGHAVHFRRLATKNVYRDSESIVKESWAVLMQNYISELEYRELSEQYGIVPVLTYNSTVILPGQTTYGAIGNTPHNVPTFNNKQSWPFKYYSSGFSQIDLDHLPYSPILIDLVDLNNQGLFFKAYGIVNKWDAKLYKKIPNDGVSGYALSQIQNAMSGTKTLNDLRSKVKAIRNNPSENIKIDTLFNKVKYYWDKYKGQIKN